MKHNKLMVSVLFLAFLGLACSFGCYNSPSTDSESLITEPDPETSAGEINITTPETKTYTSPMSGYYPGTYSFDDEISGLYGDAMDFLDEYHGSSPSSYCYIRTITNYDGHMSELLVQDAQGGSYTSGTHHIDSPQSSGTIEFLLNIHFGLDSGSTLRRQYLSFRAFDGTIGFRAMIEIHDGDILYYDGSNWQEIVSGLNYVVWYHHSISFNCNGGTNGNFTWIVSNEEGEEISRVENIEFENKLSLVEEIHFESVLGDYGGHCVYDAFGFSWDPNYNVGDNLKEGLLLSYDSSVNFDWQGYSLDGQTNKTINGNYTIPLPSDGQHYIQVFGNDSLGTIYESEVRYFDVDANPIDITIISPLSNDLFQTTPPDFEIFIDDLDLNATWYSIDGGITSIPFTGFIGTIDQVEWDKIFNGTVTVGFYANDSANRISYESVTVRKDILGPIITVISPQDEDVLGFNAPNYALSIEEFNLDEIWCSLDDGITTFPLYGLMGTLNQGEWEKFPAGEMNIRFYANDSLGHESFSDVVVEKDLTSPEIFINSLAYFTNNIFGDFAPDYDITIIEGNLDSYWYTLDNGETNISISSFAGSFNEFEWDKLGNGTLIIKFYARDEAGNLGSVSALIRKDIIAPIIAINSPNQYELFGTAPPEFELSILEANLQSSWYSLDRGVTTYPFTGLSGTINFAEWNKFSNGTVTITFSAVDSSLSQNYAETSVMVYKDVVGPIIDVINPTQNEVFGSEAPQYELLIEEFRLDSIWYSLDYGVTVLALSSLTGTLDQAAWESKGGGTVPIRFYANDSLGHESFIDVLVVKDLIHPVVTINSPNKGEVFGSTSPDYDISIMESHLESYWYTIDGGTTNITIGSLTGTISQTEWNKKGNGTVTIRFYARDEGGNEAHAELMVRKDINVPLISIISPSISDVTGHTPPDFELSVTEPNLDSMWYTLDDGTTTYPISALSGTIDLAEWNKFGEGMITIKFHAEDSAGNQAFSEVQVEKDLTKPVITINKPEIGDVFEAFSPIYSITIDEINLHSYWYSLDGGITNISITELTGTISENEWIDLSNGHVTLTFYAKDEGGNVGSAHVLITKNAPEKSTPPPAILGYDLSLIIGIFSIISILIIRKRLKS